MWSSQENINILITGPPRVGKTTLIQKLSKELEHLRPAGFYTKEIREKGIRQGFELISFDGRKGLLSHVSIQSRYRVSKYGVDVAGFEAFLKPVGFFHPETRIFIIDEIGKMECFSRQFTKLVHEIIDSDTPLIATIALKGEGLISEIKKRHDVTLYEMTHTNQQQILKKIMGPILKMQGPL